MHLRKLAFGTAIGILTLTCAAGSATAAEWQGLQGVEATPLTAAQMETVQGKRTLSSIFAALPGGSNSVTFASGASVKFWSSTPGQSISVSGTINASPPFIFGQTMTYTPTP